MIRGLIDIQDVIKSYCDSIFLNSHNMEIRMKKLILVVSAIFFLCIPPVTLSEDAIKTFDQLDDDDDGYLSKSEASVREDLKSNWIRIDKDKDKKLDVAEFSAFESETRFVPPAEMESKEIGAAPTR